MPPNPRASHDPSSAEMPRIPSSIKFSPASNVTSSINSFNMANLFGLRRRSDDDGNDDNNDSNSNDINDDKPVNHGKRHERRESCVSAISMPDCLTDEDWLVDEDDEDEDGHWNDTTGNGGAKDFEGRSEIRQEGLRRDRQEHEAHQEAKFSSNFNHNQESNPTAANNHSCHVQTIIDLKMQLAMESSAKDELHMKLKLCSDEKQELEQELYTVLAERNKLILANKTVDFCDSKSLATTMTSSMNTKSSSVNSSFISSLNSSCRSKSSSANLSSITSGLNSSCRSSISLLNASTTSGSFLNSTKVGATANSNATPSLSKQDILTLLSENTFLLTENTNLTAENTRLQQEMIHLRSSFLTFMEQSGGGKVDAEAGKLLFAKQKQSRSAKPKKGRSGVRRGNAPSSSNMKPQSIIKSTSSFTTPSSETSRSTVSMSLSSSAPSTDDSPAVEVHQPRRGSKCSASSSSSGSAANTTRSCMKQNASLPNCNVIMSAADDSSDAGVKLLRRLSDPSSFLPSHEEVCETSVGS